jgi:hypothetical protein
MANVKYTYKGDQPYIGTVKIGESNTDLVMEKGGEYSLPNDHAVVLALKAQGLLAESTIKQKS